MNRISRKAATVGAAGVLALAGVGGVMHSTAVHAGSPQAAEVSSEQAAEAPESIAQDADTLQVQSGDQSQSADESQSGDQTQSGDQSQLDTP